MKKVLVATTNRDKYSIVKKLLIDSGFSEYKFFSLKDISLGDIDIKESGNISNRAKQKVIGIKSFLSDKKFDIIIGIDDGIFIKGELIENIKEIYKDIIAGKILKENEEVIIKRAFYIETHDNFVEVLTEIPFKYKSPINPIKIEKQSYPLGYVLTPINSNVPMKLLSEEESHQYNLSFCQNELKEAYKNIVKE